MASFKLLRALLPLSLSLCSIAFELPVSQLARRDGPPPTPSGVNGDIIFTDKAQEHIYIAVSVDDTNVAVAIDSVFSDLWVSGGISNPQRIGGTSYSYPGIASPVRADIAKARLGLAAANLTDQPYLYTASDPAGFPYDFGGGSSSHGVFGLGPTQNSVAVSQDRSAFSPLDSWFRNHQAAAPFISILAAPSELDRGSEFAFAGFMSFGELIDLSKYMGIPQDKVAQLDLPDLVAINSSPTISSTDSQIIAVDEIRVSGKPVGKTSTSIPGGPTGKLAAQVQTANPYIVLDKSYVDAIYGSIPGASYSDQDRVYHLPCTTELTISIVISGTEYLFNPLSVVALTDVKDTCVGKFKASDPASKDPFDIALGLPFFESVYSIFGYQRDSSNNLGTPYWKFLSIIRAPDAHSLFVQRRGGSSANQSQGANQLGAAVAVGGAAQSGNNHNQQQSHPTTTRYTTVTFTHTPTTTVWFGSPTASTTSKAARPAQNDAVSGNLSDNDSENHESAGYILGQFKYWVPSIVVGCAVLLIIAVVSGVVLLMTRRRSGAKASSSAYSSLHASAAPTNLPLYGHDEETAAAKYADPYHDEK